MLVLSLCHRRWALWGAVVLGCAALVACGGAGSDRSGPPPTSAAPVAEKTSVVLEADQKALAEGARLNAQELAAAEQATGFRARAKALTPVPVYRFYNRSTSAHFYTVSASEAQSRACRLVR